MLKRKIESYWTKWKKSEDKKPLVIKVSVDAERHIIVPKIAKENDAVLLM